MRERHEAYRDARLVVIASEGKQSSIPNGVFETKHHESY